MNKKKKHLEKLYMLSICEEQIHNLFSINLYCFIFGLIGLFVISSKAYFNPSNGHAIYLIYLTCCVIEFIFLHIGSPLTKNKNEETRLKFYNIGVILMTQIFFIWCNFAIYFTAKDNGMIDFMPWFICIGICVTSYFYRFTHFCAIMGANLIASILITYFFIKGEYVKSTLPYTIVFIIALILIYVFKHFRELAAYEAKLEYMQHEETKNLFVASMNHELRTPLNSIIGNAQYLLTNESLSSETKEIVEGIFSSSRTMVQNVNDLLDFSKIEAGEFDVTNESFDLTKLDSNIQSTFLHMAKDKGLTFKTSIKEGTPITLIGDAGRIQQIVINLVSNAIKYTLQGSVDVQYSYSKEGLDIKVKDTGMGMSEESVADLFTPYKRFDENKNSNIQGTGLGMFIVKQLTSQMNGTISVESKLNHGTTITLLLPLEKAPDSILYKKGISSSPLAKKEEITYDFSKKTILTVDDTAMNNKVLSLLLNNTKAEIISLIDGRSCLEYLRGNKVPDLILLDHMMPEMDGIECLKIIRSGSQEYKNVPVIMLTGNKGNEYIKLYEDAGANGYIEKPIMRDKLLKMIDEQFTN